ncbi:MAG: DUF1801 domain-containing protein [bacterium]
MTDPAAIDAIDAYIAAAPAAARPRLQVLRDAIRAEAPGATERIAYGIPTWQQGENLIHIGGFERHVGLYPGPAALVAFADELADLPTSKGAIQLRHDQALPLDLVRRITRWRVDQARRRWPRRRRRSGSPA